MDSAQDQVHNAAEAQDRAPPVLNYQSKDVSTPIVTVGLTMLGGLIMALGAIPTVVIGWELLRAGISRDNMATLIAPMAVLVWGAAHLWSAQLIKHGSKPACYIAMTQVGVFAALLAYLTIMVLINWNDIISFFLFLFLLAIIWLGVVTVLLEIWDAKRALNRPSPSAI